MSFWTRSTARAGKGRRRAVALTASCLLLLLGTGGLESSEINEIGLTYSGGWFEEKKFKGFLDSGSTNSSTGYGSSTYRYKTSREYT